MNRAAAFAFGIPLLFAIVLLIWQGKGSDAILPTPPAATVPERQPSASSAPQVNAPKQDLGGLSDIAGRARVVDGDTLEISGIKIRLNGIDAPESAQTCGSGDHSYRCGDRATTALRDLLQDNPVVCNPNGTDLYHRTIATCFLNGVEVNQWLVTMGLALAFRRYSLAYVSAELAAKKAGRGLWADSFETPWDYRARMRRRR